MDLLLERLGTSEVVAIELRTTTAGVPDDGAGAVLATTMLNAADLPASGSGVLTAVSLSPGVALGVGDVVAIVLVHVSGTSGEVLSRAQQGDPYAGGGLYQRTAGNGHAFMDFGGGMDLYLRTYMTLS